LSTAQKNNLQIKVALSLYTKILKLWPKLSELIS